LVERTANEVVAWWAVLWEYETVELMVAETVVLLVAMRVYGKVGYLVDGSVALLVAKLVNATVDSTVVG